MVKHLKTSVYFQHFPSLAQDLFSEIHIDQQAGLLVSGFPVFSFLSLVVRRASFGYHLLNHGEEYMDQETTGVQCPPASEVEQRILSQGMKIQQKAAQLGTIALLTGQKPLECRYSLGPT